MRLGLFVLLSLAVCAAQTPGNQSDVYISPPYFDQGENLSIQNCGNNETTRNRWLFNVQTGSERCYAFVAISHRIVLGPSSGCFSDFKKNDKNNKHLSSVVFPDHCEWRDAESCKRLFSVQVLDVIKFAVSPKDKWTIVKTEEMPSEVMTPLCLFNRDNAMDSQLQRESPYFELLMHDDPTHFVFTRLLTQMMRKVMGQSNCSRILNSDELGELESHEIPIQNILCVEETDNGYKFLINFYKGRYFLRGVKLHWNVRYYIDILPYIDEIAMHAKDISVLRSIPETKEPRGFTEPENLSFPNCGMKPTSRRRKRENDDSSEVLPPTSLIFGGQMAQTGDHPWHVSIENEVTGGACGGTLISPTVVLTAAHCIYGSEAEDFRVSVGMYDKRKRRAPGVQTTLLSRLIVHPKYNSTIFMSDVGLMILKTKINITNNVRPICLWNDDSDSNLVHVAGSKAMAVGFGLVDNHTRTDKLQEVRLPIKAHKECYLSNRRFFGKYLRPGDNFCAGYINGTTACNGDSGGSLSVEKDGRWYIRGMVSFGVPKKVKFEGEERSLCHPNQYTLFADVASYVDWIVENTPDISFRN